MKALLFDLDGTLIHSMPLHQQAWRTWLGSVGMARREDTSFARSAGRTNEEILLDLFPHHSASERAAMAEAKETMYRDLAQTSLSCVAGAIEFMRSAQDQGLRLAICTAAPQGNIDVALQRFPFAPLIETLTSPADGLRGKPHPDIFEEAARRLNVAPQDCLVFEDAPLGVEAAQRAGMRAVALTTTLGAEAFASFPNLIQTAPDFRSLQLSALAKAHHA
jgi:beta-phosphoglucomutase